MRISRYLLCWISAVALASAALPLPAKPSISVGQIAPCFSGHDQDGHTWKLSQHLGKKFVFLYFYPNDDTASGTVEALGVRDHLVECKMAGVEVVGVSSDSQESHKNFAFKYDLPFPLLTDTCGEIAGAYGVLMNANKKLDRRVSFLIGQDGRILRITTSPNPIVHLKAMAEALVELTGRDSF